MTITNSKTLNAALKDLYFKTVTVMVL